jgi:outer membrane autotransporter protein
VDARVIAERGVRRFPQSVPIESTTTPVTLQNTGAAGSTTFDVSASSVINSPGDGISGDASQDWTVSNEGSITGASAGIRLLSATVNGATIDNFGSIVNIGSVGGGANAGIVLRNGGTVTNHVGATINSQSDGIYTNAAGSSVTNDGAIVANVTGVYFGAGGTFMQGASGSIHDNGAPVTYGVISDGGTLTGSNAGTIEATSIAVLYRGGTGTFTNTNTLTGSVGVELDTTGVTVANGGTITGTSGTAINITGNANALVLTTGSVLNGDAVSTGTGNTLTLQGVGSEANNLAGFSTLTMGGSNWQLSGNVSTNSGIAAATEIRSGQLTLSGTLTNSNGGGTTIDALGTLQLGNGGTSGSIAGNVIDNGLLKFDRSDASTFDGVVSGTGSVAQVGTGTTVLNAANSYGGNTTVTIGTLAVGDATHADATIGAGAVTVAAGATLGGYGTVPGSVSNTGTIAVANALPAFATAVNGSFTIAGNLVNQGVVNLAAASGQIGNVLTVAGNYSGTNGQLRLNTQFDQGATASQSDQLVVGGNVSGATGIVLHASGLGAPTTGDGVELVRVGGTSAPNSFHLLSPVQGGAYQYLLYQGGAASSSDWYLRSELDAPQASASAQPSVLAYRPGVAGYSMTPSLNVDYGFTILGRLQDRVGDVASLDDAQPDNKNGIWGRISGQSLDADSMNRFSTEERTFFAQFGKDWTLARGESGGSTHAGVTVNFGSSSANFDDNLRSINPQLTNSTGSVETQAQSIGGYWTRYLPDGMYFDGVGQLTHYRNQYGDVVGDSTSQNGFGVGVSGEAGKPFLLGSSRIAIEPQVQVLYQYVHLNGFDDGVSSIGGTSTNALRGRIGFRLFRANLSNDTKTSTATPYFTADVLHDFFSPGETNVGGTSFDNGLSKTWYELGFGVTTSMGRSSELYANVKYARNLGGEYRQDVFGQAGYRYSW